MERDERDSLVLRLDDRLRRLTLQRLRQARSCSQDVGRVPSRVGGRDHGCWPLSLHR